jgi:hypothetical protein
MPFKFDVQTPPDRPVVVVSMEIPVRELYAALNDQSVSDAFMHRVLTELVRHASQTVHEMISRGEVDRIVAQLIKEEVKKQVSDAVEERVNDFFGDE